MSLNAEEMARTQRELRANVALTGLSTDEIAADLGLTTARVDAALGAGPSDPVDVWQLRDYLVLTLRAAGRDPVPFTVLTDRNRRRAQRWFRLREVSARASS